MAQIINTNIASLNAQRMLNKSQAANETAMQRLSSGLRINSAKDDAAGLAISTRFESQIKGTNVAIRNAGDGISLAQTAEGAMSSMATNLQRIRELALQSANETNTGLDRQALQEEVNQLKEEIKNVAQNTNFNGKKLLDGSFQNASFQTGANVGETIKVSIAKLDTSTLGSAQSAGISSNVSGTGLAGVTTNAMGAGDLVINGVAIGASSGTDDTSSTAKAESSAIAKAAAINKVSDQTGVTAVVNENTVEGTAVTASADANSALAINGVTVNVETRANLTVEQNMAAVAEAINAKADATGVKATVVAVDGATNGFRVDLSAADGRNITLNQATASQGNASVFGLASAAEATPTTFTGNVTLVSNDGSDISLSTNTGSIDKAGFEEGTFSGVNGGVVGDAGITGRAALDTGDLTINGIAVGTTSASDDTASPAASASASAISLAAAINDVSDKTGVTAEVNQNTVYSGAVGTAAGTSTFTMNGQSFSVALGADQAANNTALMDAINAKAGVTGIKAEALGDNKFKLIADDGRNIDITAATADSGLTVGTNIGSVTLKSAGQFTLGSETGNIERAGLRVGTYGGAETGTKLEDLDISTVAGANAAIKAVDNALKTISSKQAELGAVQNRFSNTISNLSTLSENLSAANSRIRDADFAAESAEMSRTSVLQQAGMSILAQANGKSQQVLSLLR